MRSVTARYMIQSATVLVAAAVGLASCNAVDDLLQEGGALDPFMFHVFSAGHEQFLGGNYADDLKEALGENLAWTAPPYFWSGIEPTDDGFDWTELDDFVDDHSHVHRVINLGPEFMPAGGGDFFIAGELPGWIDNSYANPELRTQYGELIEAIVERYQDDIELWWIGLEVNSGGDGLSWDQWKEWLAWQVGVMRAVDQDCRIAISFGSWSDYHEQIPPNAVHEVDGVLELVAGGTDFEVIAIEYHYGTLQDGDLDDMRDALDDLESVGKDIFIWEVFYPAETDSQHQHGWSWVHEPAGGYSEEWQAEQWYGTLAMAYEDPQVVGINFLHFQDITYSHIAPTEWEAGWRCHAGIVNADGTPRQAYHDVRDYWNSVAGRRTR